MPQYTVIRSDDHLEHHGILGMKWGVWNEETRARRMGSKSSKKRKYDYSKLSDTELQKRLNRKRNEDQLRQLEKKEAPKSKYQLTNDTLTKVGLTLAAVSGIVATSIAISNNAPKLAANAKIAITKYKDVKTNLLDPAFSKTVDWSMVKNREYFDLSKVPGAYNSDELLRSLKYI